MTTFEESTLAGLQDSTAGASDPEKVIIALDGDPSQDPSWAKAEKGLVRKLDMTLLPMVWVLQARLVNFERDLDLTGNQFNVAVSILNVGYMLAQLPSNMILTRVRPSVYLPCCVGLWSCVSAMTAAAQSYGGLLAIRFVLGIAEAPFFPGAFYLLSCWYTRKELALRTAILYTGLVLATAFSGLIAAGVFVGMDGYRGFAGWQWLFILEGFGSFVAGVVALIVLPDYVDSITGSGRWLFSAKEREVAARRVAMDRVSVPHSDRSVWNGLFLAVTDYRTWVFVLLLSSNHTAYGFNNFFPTILSGFKIGDRTTSMTLTAPPYLVGTVVSLAVAWSSDRVAERGYHISDPMLVAAVGFAISVANSMVYSWSAAVLNQTPEKRACATAIINLLSQLGNIWSPYFFPDSDRPRYVTAMCLMMGFTMISIASALAMKMILRRENKILLREAEVSCRKPILYPL